MRLSSIKWILGVVLLISHVFPFVHELSHQLENHSHCHHEVPQESQNRYEESLPLCEICMIFEGLQPLALGEGGVEKLIAPTFALVSLVRNSHQLLDVYLPYHARAGPSWS